MEKACRKELLLVQNFSHILITEMILTGGMYIIVFLCICDIRDICDILKMLFYLVFTRKYHELSNTLKTTAKYCCKFSEKRCFASWKSVRGRFWADHISVISSLKSPLNHETRNTWKFWLFFQKLIMPSDYHVFLFFVDHTQSVLNLHCTHLQVVCPKITAV